MKTTKKSITIEQALKESNSSANQTIKQKFVGQHIYCNVGSLCEYVLSNGFEDNNAPFTIDDIENYYSYPEYNGQYASFEGGNDEQRQEEIERLKDLLEELTGHREFGDVRESIEEIESNYESGKVPSLKKGFDGGMVVSDHYGQWTHNKNKSEKIMEEIEALENLESEPQEILEWWAISDYLFDRLKEQGQCVVDAGSCYVWGRCTTGQAILLDGCISRICGNMEILEGQTNSWA